MWHSVHRLLYIHSVSSVKFKSMKQMETKYQTFKKLILILPIYSIVICHRQCHMHCVLIINLTKDSTLNLNVIDLKNLKQIKIMFQINKILNVHPSVDLCRFYNRNAIDKFQITSKFYHQHNVNRRYTVINHDY